MGPLFDILEEFPNFIIHSVDDVVEDCAKLSIMYFSYKILLIPYLSSSVMLFATGAAISYYIANEISDAMGDKMDVFKATLLTKIGLEHLLSQEDESKSKSSGVIIETIEDFVEDVAKLGCLKVSYEVGKVAGREVFSPYISSFINIFKLFYIFIIYFNIYISLYIHFNFPYSNLMGHFVDGGVRYGTPLAEYNKCNEYSDILGDKVQELLTKVEESIAVFPIFLTFESS